MNTFILLRAIVWLKRLSKSNDRIAASLERLVALQEMSMPGLRPPRHVELSVPTAEDWDKGWQTTREQEMEGTGELNIK